MDFVFDSLPKDRDQQRDGGLRGNRASSSPTPASYRGQWPETLG